jgi:hypothetical protein
LLSFFFRYFFNGFFLFAFFGIYVFFLIIGGRNWRPAPPKAGVIISPVASASASTEFSTLASASLPGLTRICFLSRGGLGVGLFSIVLCFVWC